MKRTLILERAGWIVIGLCVLPLIAMATTDSRPEETPAETSHIDTLLTIHDVRTAIDAPREPSSECQQSEAERGR